MRSPNCLLELFADVTCSTDLSKLDSVQVQQISAWNFRQQWDHWARLELPVNVNHTEKIVGSAELTNHYSSFVDAYSEIADLIVVPTYNESTWRLLHDKRHSLVTEA